MIWYDKLQKQASQSLCIRINSKNNATNHPKSTNARTVSIRIKSYIHIIPKFVKSPFKRSNWIRFHDSCWKTFPWINYPIFKSKFLKLCDNEVLQKLTSWGIFLLVRILTILEITLTILKTSIISLLSLLYPLVYRFNFCSLQTFLIN